jgi:hypothetical protein
MTLLGKISCVVKTCSEQQEIMLESSSTQIVINLRIFIQLIICILQRNFNIHYDTFDEINDLPEDRLS